MMRLLAISSTAMLLALTATVFAEVDFNRDIRPMLSDNCFQCHGPDEPARKAKFRLDLEGDVDWTEFIARVSHADPEERMPPPKTKKRLSAEQIVKLEKWIAAGARYEKHWSFLPVANPEPPKSGFGNPIDAFISAKLTKNGLQLSPEASPQTLIRRFYLDLIGLLPEPTAVNRFVAEYVKNPDAAVDRLTDELLASPHYGERWGRHWLDQARYADSNGYTIDGERVMWPYRDWVIRAVNDDLPFDQFTIEQLAGDLLPQSTKAQLIASGFHRNTLINQEGGTDDEQFRNEEVVDRVNTTGAVWMGLTLGCAQCHSHKFDPISQKEYFSCSPFLIRARTSTTPARRSRSTRASCFSTAPIPS